VKQQIRVAQQAQPFAPFEAELVGGRGLRVPHPESIDVQPGKAPHFAVTRPGGRPEACDVFVVLSVRPGRQRGGCWRKAG